MSPRGLRLELESVREELQNCREAHAAETLSLTQQLETERERREREGDKREGETERSTMMSSLGEGRSQRGYNNGRRMERLRSKLRNQVEQSNYLRVKLGRQLRVESSILCGKRVKYLISYCMSTKNSTYHIVLIFRGSLISRISRIWNRSRNLFNENLSHCAVTPMGNTNSRNLFNEFLQSSYSRKFRPAKYKRYTVIMCLCILFKAHF